MLTHVEGMAHLPSSAHLQHRQSKLVPSLGIGPLGRLSEMAKRHRQDDLSSACQSDQLLRRFPLNW